MLYSWCTIQGFTMRLNWLKFAENYEIHGTMCYSQTTPDFMEKATAVKIWIKLSNSDGSKPEWLIIVIRRGSSPKIIVRPGPWASSCHHKHYVGDKKTGKTFKNLGPSHKLGPGTPDPSVEPRLIVIGLIIRCHHRLWLSLRNSMQTTLFTVTHSHGSARVL